MFLVPQIFLALTRKFVYNFVHKK